MGGAIWYVLVMALAAIATGAVVMQRAPVIEGVRRNDSLTLQRVPQQTTENLILLRPSGPNQGHPVGFVTVSLALLCVPKDTGSVLNR